MTSSPRARRAPDPRDYQIHAVFGLPAAPTFGLGRIPTHSPYRYGQWVQYHTYRGTRPPATTNPWRGYVLGYMGSTLLRGLTDDGREWCEHWGHIVPDGQRETGGGIECVCCPRRPTRSARPVRRDVEQLGLFGGADLLDLEVADA